MWECNGLPTQTQQSTHALPFFCIYLGRIERESSPQGSISRTIVPHLILAPVPTPENLRQIDILSSTLTPREKSQEIHRTRGLATLRAGKRLSVLATSYYFPIYASHLKSALDLTSLCCRPFWISCSSFSSSLVILHPHLPPSLCASSYRPMLSSPPHHQLYLQTSIDS